MSNPQFGTLTVLGGPYAGHQLALDQAVEEILIGSDPDCAIALDLPGVSPVHARIWIDHEGATVHDTHSPRGTYLNDDPVNGQAPLKDGDILWLGAPGEAESVMIQCRLSLPTEPQAFAPMAEGWEDQVEEPAAFSFEEAAPVAPIAPVHSYERELEMPDSGSSEPIALRSFPEDEPTPADVFAEPAAEPEAFPAMDPEPVAADAGWASEAAPEVLEVVEPQAEAPADSFAFVEEPPAEAPAADAMDAFTFEDAAPAPAPAAAPVPLTMDEAPLAFEEPVAAAPAAEAFAVAEPASDEPVFEVEEPGPKVGEVAFDDVEKPELDNAWEAAPAWQAPAPEPDPQIAAAEDDVFDVAAEEGPAPAPVPPPPPAPVAAAVAAPVATTAAAEMRAARAAAAAAAGTPAEPPARPAPAPRAPRPATTPAARPASVPPAAAPAKASGGKPIGLIAGAAAVVLVLAGAGAWFALRTPAPKVTGVAPNRVSRGATLTISGENFAADPAGNTVTFGTARAKVLQATATMLQVQVPEAAPTTPGQDTPVPVTVTVGEKAAEAVSVNLFLAPRLAAVEPGAALAGEEVVLKGSGFGGQPTVTVAGAAAEVLEVKPDTLRIRVPAALQAARGSSVPVVVTSGPEKTAPFALLVGHLPMLLSVQPAGAAPGDVVTLGGHGFAPAPGANEVKFGDTRALVSQAAPTQLTVVVPRVAAGEAVPVTVRVAGQANVADATATVGAPADPPGFRFVAEPLVDDAGHVHAALVSPLGTSFVVSDAGGRSAGERAAEAAARLNGAAAALAASASEGFVLRTGASGLVITLGERNTPVLEVAAEDAAAHAEPWAGGGAAPSAGRLAAWWTALLQDHAAVLVRGGKPTQAASAAAAAAKPLADVGAALRQPPFTSRTFAALKPATRESLKTLASRVPDGVPEPAGLAAAAPGPAPAAAAAAPAAPTTVAAAPAAPATPEPPSLPPLTLAGEWFGAETLGGLRTAVTVTFTKSSGNIRFERAVPVTVQMTNLTERKGKVSYRAGLGSNVRYYAGTWDGTRIAGTVASDAAGKNVIGQFEIKPVQ